MNTQLITASSYDTSRMIFSDPVEGNIPDSKPAITYKRINISTTNDDGTVGELVIPTERLYSYGVSENVNMNTQKVDGYVLPLVLYDRDGATEEQRAFVQCFTNIVDKCKEYLLENKEELGQYELEPNDLKKLNPIYYKKDKGKIVEGAAPTLYAKLIVKKDKKDGNKIISVFYDEETGDQVNPIELLGKACYSRAAIKFESIFIGNKISLQVKLYEAEVKVVSSGTKRLLSNRPKADTRVSVQTESRPIPLPLQTDNDGDSIIDEDDDIPVEETIKEIPKKPVRKVTKVSKK